MEIPENITKQVLTLAITYYVATKHSLAKSSYYTEGELRAHAKCAFSDFLYGAEHALALLGIDLDQEEISKARKELETTQTQ